MESVIISADQQGLHTAPLRQCTFTLIKKVKKGTRFVLKYVHKDKIFRASDPNLAVQGQLDLAIEDLLPADVSPEDVAKTIISICFAELGEIVKRGERDQRVRDYAKGILDDNANRFNKPVECEVIAEDSSDEDPGLKQLQFTKFRIAEPRFPGFQIQQR
jgi:hypothetical protein